MKIPARTIFAALLLTLGAAAVSAGDIQPAMAEKDAVVLQNDFSESGKLPKKTWQPRQHTRWAAGEGVFHGRESTAEYQASRSDHQGFEPRLMLRNLPDDYIIDYRFRILSGEYTAIGAFLEFGHHRARLSFHADGAALTYGGLKSHVTLDSKPGFKLEEGRWYRVLGEVKGDEVLIRFERGPTFYGTHPEITGEKDGFGICGLRGGAMDLDDVTVWGVKPDERRSWSKVRAELTGSGGGGR